MGFTVLKHVRPNDLPLFLSPVDAMVDMFPRAGVHVPRDGVHIGVQTGNSQQVDVTVHTPYSTDDPTNTEEETVNSEIKMNICDEHGQVTVTTAEITNNATSGDGSEAEVVLHVRTTYPKADKEPKSGESKKNESISVKCEKSGTKADKSDKTVAKTEKCDIVVGKSDIDSKLSGDDGHTSSKAGSSNSSEGKSKCSVFHRRAHSTGSLKKPAKKQEFGSLSMKNKKSLQRELQHDQLTLQNSDTPVLEPDLGQSGDLLEQVENKLPGDTDKSSTENEALSQSGCFMKIFSKKFQNQSEKVDKLDKEKFNGGGVKNSDLIPGDCPDVVSCALQAELKRKDSGGSSEKDLDITKEYDPDRLIGLIAQESHTTSF